MTKLIITGANGKMEKLLKVLLKIVMIAKSLPVLTLILMITVPSLFIQA